MSNSILPEGVYPVATNPGALDAPFWEATRREELRIQRCTDCGRFQWGPEHICHHCHSFALEFARVEPTGRIFSWERVWHPAKPELSDHVPFVIVLVELDGTPGIHLIGNLAGDQEATVEIGTPVRARFEHHDDYTLVQWERDS